MQTDSDKQTRPIPQFSRRKFLAVTAAAALAACAGGRPKPNRGAGQTG